MEVDRVSYRQYSPALRRLNLRDGKYYLDYGYDDIEVKLQPLSELGKKLLGDNTSRVIDRRLLNKYDFDDGHWRINGRFCKTPVVPVYLDSLLNNSHPLMTLGDDVAGIVELGEKLLADFQPPQINNEGYTKILTQGTHDRSGHFYPRLTQVTINGKGGIDDKTEELYRLISSYLEILDVSGVAVRDSAIYTSVVHQKLKEAKVTIRNARDEHAGGGRPDILFADTLSVPKLTEEEAAKLIMNARRENRLRGYITDKPTLSELEDNTEMLAKFQEATKSIKGLVISYLRKRDPIVFTAGSNFGVSPEAWNMDLEEKDRMGPLTAIIDHEGNIGWGSPHKEGNRMISNNGPIVHYMGPSWCVRFHYVNDEGVTIDVLQDNEIFCVTGQMYADAIRPYRPDLLELWQPDPEAIYFVCSYWCQRSGAFAKHNGILDFYNVFRMRWTLAEWITYSLVPKCVNMGINIPGYNEKAMVDGQTQSARLAAIKDYLTKANALKS